MNKTTCKVCGYVFELTKKRHYIAREKTELFLLPSNKMEPTLYDAFDCPLRPPSCQPGAGGEGVEGEVEI